MKRRVWLGLALTLAAFALRVYRLDAPSLWYDELFSLVAGSLPFPAWLQAVFQDRVHPPGYYLIGQGWFAISHSEFAIRYLSVLFGALAVPAMFQLGKWIDDETTGLIAAAGLTISPLHVWYSQETRMYALIVCLAILANLFFLRLLQREDARAVFGYAVTTLAALYTHYLYAVVVLAQFAFLAFQRVRFRRALPRWLIAMVGVGALYAPWLIAVLATGGLTQAGISWIPAARPVDLVLTLYTLTLGAASWNGAAWLWLVPLLGAALAGIGFARVRRRAAYLLVWLLFPILFVFLVSLDLPIPGKRSVYHDRYFIASLPAYLVLIALGLRALAARCARVTMAGALVLLVACGVSLGLLYFDPAHARDDWRGAVAHLRAQADPTREVLIVYAGQILPMAYYEPGDLPRLNIYMPTPDAPASLEAQLSALGFTPRRVWFLVPTFRADGHGFFPSWEEQREIAQNDPLVRWLAARYPLESEKQFQSLLVQAYRVSR